MSAAEDLPRGRRTSLHVLVPAFMISELRRAFEIGFLLFVPFLIIDLVVASMLMSMGMMMLPPITVSLPFKLIFFVLVDGWNLVAGSPRSMAQRKESGAAGFSVERPVVHVPVVVTERAAVGTVDEPVGEPGQRIGQATVDMGDDNAIGRPGFPANGQWRIERFGRPLFAEIGTVQHDFEGKPGIVVKDPARVARRAIAPEQHHGIRPQLPIIAGKMTLERHATQDTAETIEHQV
jgi:hypothetical protein